MGGVDGITRVYDRDTGALVHRSEHKAGGCVQVFDVSSLASLMYHMANNGL